MSIRPATSGDWDSMIRIYNEAVDMRIATADTEHATLQSKQTWLASHADDRFPIFIDERDDVVAGWCSLSPYRYGRPALRGTAEISYYISEGYQRQGIAHGLVAHAISDCGRLGIETLVAILLESNVPSINLLSKFDFEEWGRLPKIAEIDGNRYDHLYMGRRVRE